MRSKYIYLIYESKPLGSLLSAHTVKHEAHAWLVRSKWGTSGKMAATLWRLPDGLSGLPERKYLTRVEWDEKLLGLDKMDI